MPNAITSTGLTTATQAELIDNFRTAMESIYGPDINLSSDTPDGQMMMIFIQSVLDSLDLVKQVYTSFDPDSAIGVTLDERVAINGIQRRGGTYTITPITIVTSQSVTLYGLDQSVEDVYTVQDNAGTKWLLQETTSLLTGTHSLDFRAENPGETLTIPNTITIPTTIVLGVDSVNNPSTYSSLGINEETDAELRIRRQKSVSLPSQGYLNSLLASLLNINGIVSANVYENNTSVVDSDGTQPNTIWVVVDGTYDEALVANAIYVKRNAGCGMRGAHTYIITQADNSLFEVRWDDVTDEIIWIEFDVSPLDGVSPIDTVGLKNYISENLPVGVAGQVNINDLATICQQFDDNILVTGAGFSFTSGGTYLPKLSPSSKNKRFLIDTTKINITVI